MAGLGSLTQGFHQGFHTLGNYYDRKDQREQRKWQRNRLETQDAQNAELHDLKVGEYERKEDLRDLNAMRYRASQSEGPVKVDLEENEWARDRVFQQFRERTKVDPSKIVGENRAATEQAVSYFEQVAQGQDNRRPIDVMNDERTLSSAQVLLGELVNENLGETFEANGKTYTIKDKRIANIVPDQTGEGVNIGLKVRGVGPDGDEVEYDAPMTDGHSAQDDLVMNIPIEKVMSRVQGYKALLEGTANMSPEEVVSAIEPEIVRLGGELPEDENFEVIRDDAGNPIAQMGPDGRRYDLPESMQRSQNENFRLLYDQQGNPVAQMGPDGRRYDLPESMLPGGGDGGEDSLDGIDEKRLFTRGIDEVESTFRINLGQEFIGKPEVAKLRSLAANETSRIIHQERVMGSRGAELVPEIVGNTAAQMALSGRYQGLRLSEAKKQAREDLKEPDSWKTPWKKSDPAEIEKRAREIQENVREQYRSDLEREISRRLSQNSGQARGLQSQNSGQARGRQSPPQGSRGGQSPGRGAGAWVSADGRVSLVPPDIRNPLQSQPQEQPRGQPQEQPRGQPQEQPRGQPQEQPRGRGLSRIDRPRESDPNSVGMQLRENLPGVWDQAKYHGGLHFGPPIDAIKRGSEPVRDAVDAYTDYQGEMLKIPLDVIRNVRDFFSPGTDPIPDSADNFIRKWNDEDVDAIQRSEVKSMMKWLRSLDEKDLGKPEVQGIKRALKEYNDMRSR